MIEKERYKSLIHSKLLSLLGYPLSRQDMNGVEQLIFVLIDRL